MASQTAGSRSEREPVKRVTSMTATRSAMTRRTSTRPGIRAPSIATTRNVSSRMGDRAGAVSPAESLMSTATTAGSKRKERGYEADGSAGEETCINVFVRCRGRNEREVKENSNVVLRTEGVKGKVVELFMGSNALSNKTYNFDGVFSPAADQSIIFDEVVRPILDEVRSSPSDKRDGRGPTLIHSANPLGCGTDVERIQLHNFRVRPNRHR